MLNYFDDVDTKVTEMMEKHLKNKIDKNDDKYE